MGLRDLGRLVAGELGQWRLERAAGGLRNAFRRRLQYHAGTEELARSLLHVEHRIEALSAAAAEDQAHRAGLEARLSQVGNAVEELAPWPAAGTRLATRLEVLERQWSTTGVMAWVAQATLSTRPLVSVVLPTRNRSARLRRAVRSMVDQQYGNWELLVVDDGGGDDTAEVVRSFGDDRMNVSSIPWSGVCAARNHALDRASGEVIAYLDDDNTMHSGWLKTVVWAFEQRPDVDVLYGAYVVDDVSRLQGAGGGSLPVLFLHPYEPRAVLDANVADIGAIAHRAGLAQARFDESLRELGDWDLLLRLTADRDPLVVPAISCFYTTDAPDRLTGGPTFTSDQERVRAKNQGPRSGAAT